MVRYCLSQSSSLCTRQGPEADMIVLQPYEYHVNTSELVRILKTGHYNVQLTDEEWRTLYTWIDTMNRIKYICVQTGKVSHIRDMTRLPVVLN